MNQNLIKKIASLSHAKYRQKHGLFIVEGAHVVAELLKSDWETSIIVVTHQAADSGDFGEIIKAATRKDIAVERIAQKEISRLSATEAPQGIMAVVKLPEADFGRLLSQKRILVADGVSDPGNIGTMMRGAAAFGFGGFVTTTGSADIFNPKVVRASQGALFHLVVANHIEVVAIAKMIKGSHKIYSLSAHSQSDLQKIKPSTRAALVVGAEIAGVSQELLDISDQILRIPMGGQVESLNAAVAAAIAMYEFAK